MPKLPHYKQLDSMDCGPACPRMVAKYYGKAIACNTCVVIRIFIIIFSKSDKLEKMFDFIGVNYNEDKINEVLSKPYSFKT
jgi:hypothetical protein